MGCANMLACGLSAVCAAAAGCGSAAHEPAGTQPRAAAAATAPIVRVRARPLPRRPVLALPQLGMLRARCGYRDRFLVSYTRTASYDENVAITAAGTTLKAHVYAKPAFFSIAARDRKLGRARPRATPLLTLTLSGAHEPFEVHARVRMRLADALDGTRDCVATRLKASAATRYH